MVQDWGGPIGLGFAGRCPDCIRSLIICNTWAWPAQGTKHLELRYVGLVQRATRLLGLTGCGYAGVGQHYRHRKQGDRFADQPGRLCKGSRRACRRDAGPRPRCGIIMLFHNGCTERSAPLGGIDSASRPRCLPTAYRLFPRSGGGMLSARPEPRLGHSDLCPLCARKRTNFNPRDAAA
jgi:pimeloyl-ACP methyl ester carboxylesterase